MPYEQDEKINMTIEDAAAILSETLQDVTERKTSLKRALAISRIALALSKVLETKDLKGRVDLLEQMLKKRKQ